MRNPASIPLDGIILLTIANSDVPLVKYEMNIDLAEKMHKKIVTY